jgi:small-conductance mechanosensitive channel
MSANTHHLNMWRAICLSKKIWLQRSAAAVTTSSHVSHLSHVSHVSRDFSSSNDNPPPKSSFNSKFSESYIKYLIKSTGFIEDDDLTNLLAKSVKIGVYSIVGITFLGTIGFDTKPIIASISVFGFATGYALKDAATHFASGVMLVIQKPFKKGDYLKVLITVPHEGIVEAIDVRYVHLRTKDNQMLLIPCSTVYGNSIIVSSTPPKDWPPPVAPVNPSPPTESPEKK